MVFIKAKEKGNGFLKEKSGECFAILPNHVTSNYLGNISILNKQRVKSYGRLIETYEPDLAILRIKKGGKQKCSSWQLVEDFNTILSNSVDGTIEYIDDFGTSNLIPVHIIAIDQQSISIVPKIESQNFQKGMSGSAFYIKNKDKKLFSGMLMSIEDNLKTGHVYQADDILRNVSPFFTERKKKNVGILILKDNISDLKISSSLIAHLNANNKYSALSNFKSKEVIYKEFDNIFYGKNRKSLGSKFKDDLDQILLGKVTLVKDINEKNMFVIRMYLEVNIYSTKDFSLIKSMTISGKGINSNSYIAENQSLKSLLTNLKKQL